MCLSSTEQEIAERMAKLSGKDWHRTVMSVSWACRRGELNEGTVPPALRVMTDTVLDPERWLKFKLEVSRIRRVIHRHRQAERQTARTTSRRDYMRTYMRCYRSKK